MSFRRSKLTSPQKNDQISPLKNLLSLKGDRIQSLMSGKDISKRATNSLEFWRRGFCSGVSSFLEKLELLRNVLPNLDGAPVLFGERPTHTPFSRALSLGSMRVAAGGCGVDARVKPEHDGGWGVLATLFALPFTVLFSGGILNGSSS